MSRLTHLAGAALGGLLIAGFVQPPVLELHNRPPETATAMPVSTATLEALSVTDRTGIARGHVITVLRRPDDSIARLWTDRGDMKQRTLCMNLRLVVLTAQQCRQS